MLNSSFLKRGKLIVGGVALLLTSSVFAGKDRAYFSEVTEVKVNTVSVATTVNVNEGDGGSVKLNDPINPGDNVSLLLKWSIQNNRKPSGAYTNYPKDISFSAETTNTPETSILISPIDVSDEICTFSNNSTQCSTTVSFQAPENTTGAIHIEVKAETDESSQNGLLNSDVSINVSVVEQMLAPAPIATSISVADKCYAYQAGNVDFDATLKTTTDAPVVGATLNFGVNSEDDMLNASLMSSAETDANGVASVTYNIDALEVGSYYVFADFDGTSAYLPTTGSGTLGIYYNFGGFLPPINPEGNSIFGNGRVIPVKIKLLDANGNSVPNAKPEIQIYKISVNDLIGEVPVNTESVSSADSGQIMRYDPLEEQYIYNADLSELENGTYTIKVDTGGSDCNDSTTHSALITVEKKVSKKK